MPTVVKIPKTELIKLVEKYFQAPIDELVITETSNPKYPQGFSISRGKILPGDVVLTKSLFEKGE